MCSWYFAKVLGLAAVIAGAIGLGFYCLVVCLI
jgi:hypothetical protein